MTILFIRFERKFFTIILILNLKKILYIKIFLHTHIQILGILSLKKGVLINADKKFFHEVCFKKLFSNLFA